MGSRGRTFRLDEALIGTGERIRRVLPKRARKPGAPDIEVAVTDKGRVVLFRCKSPCTPKHLDDILKDLPEGHKARQAVKKLRDELAKPDTKLTGDDAAGRLAKIAGDHPDLPQLKKHVESQRGAASDTWVRPKGWRLPKNGKWSGTPGHSDFIPDNPIALGLKPGQVVPFRNGRPDFSKWSKGNFTSKEALTGVHQTDMPKMIRTIAEEKGWT